MALPTKDELNQIFVSVQDAVDLNESVAMVYEHPLVRDVDREKAGLEPFTSDEKDQIANLTRDRIQLTQLEENLQGPRDYIDQRTDQEIKDYLKTFQPTEEEVNRVAGLLSPDEERALLAEPDSDLSSTGRRILDSENLLQKFEDLVQTEFENKLPNLYDEYEAKFGVNVKDSDQVELKLSLENQLAREIRQSYYGAFFLDLELGESGTYDVINLDERLDDDLVKAVMTSAENDAYTSNDFYSFIRQVRAPSIAFDPKIVLNPNASQEELNEQYQQIVLADGQISALIDPEKSKLDQQAELALAISKLRKKY